MAKAKTQQVDEMFLRQVWENQPGEYIFVSKKESGNWTDKAFGDIDEAVEWLNDQPAHADVYWCPTLFTKPKRRKENIEYTRYLWADLDFADPRNIAPDLKPTIAWESSPGRYQALWELDRAYDALEVEPISKALSYYIGADKGGWDLTQVLRIPGAYNNKYPDTPKSKLLWSNSKGKYKLGALRDYLEVDATSPEEIDNLDSDLTVSQVLAKRKNQIPRKVLGLLLQKNVSQGNRSDILWYIEHELVKAGLNVQEIVTLIKSSAWNKFAGRNDEDQRLKHEIARAIEDEVLDGDSDKASSTNRTKQRQHSEGGDGQHDDASDGNSESGLSLRVESDDVLMSDLSSSPGWLIEGFWTRRSHGIVAGEPKSFKSTILIDFALSVASGKPFFGQFPVVETGPVLIIQNENASWIMKDRLEKIRAHKDLVGSVKTKKNGNLLVEFPPSLPIHYINQQGYNLNDPIHRDLLEEVIKQIKPILIIFDPLYLMFDGDINSAKDLAPVLQYLLDLKFRYNTGIILVHHWNKGGVSSRGGQRMLGSTTLHGWTEAAWYIKTRGGQEDKVEEGPQDDFSATQMADVNNAASSSMVTIEREFRGAGLYPKVDVSIGMGEFGDAKYSATVERHKQSNGQKKVDRGQLTSEVMEILKMHPDGFSVRSLSTEVGAGRRTVQEIVDSMLEDKTLEKNGPKVKIKVPA